MKYIIVIALIASGVGAVPALIYLIWATLEEQSSKKVQ